MTAERLELYTPYIMALKDFNRIPKQASSVKFFMPTEINLYQKSWSSMSMRGVFVGHNHTIHDSGVWNLEKKEIHQYREMNTKDIEDYGWLIIKGIFELGGLGKI